jgi:hypothetical protein
VQHLPPHPKEDHPMTTGAEQLADTIAAAL